MKKTKYQKCNTQIIDRVGIKNAPYNPRKMPKAAMKQLKKNLDRVGLLTPIVVNKNTMNIVSGHQRLACVDALEKSQNYSLEVSLVDLTDKEEMEQNIFFNNQFVQGEWDLELLEQMLKNIELEGAVENTGFNETDLNLIFGEARGIFNADKAGEEIKTDIDKIKEIKELTKNSLEKLNEINDPEFFIIGIFKDRARRNEFLKLIDYNDNDKYVDGEHLFLCVEGDK